MFPSQKRRCLALLALTLGLTFTVIPAVAAAELPTPFLAGDFQPGADRGSLSVSNLAAIGGKIYFSAFDPEHGKEPWVSDGSAAGTRRLADLCPGPCSSHPLGFTALGETGAIFQATDAASEFIVVSVAGGEATQVASSGTTIEHWTALGSTFFFATRGDQLFRSDGTREGTRLVQELHPHPSYGLPQELGAVNGAVYFGDAGQLYRITESESEAQPFYTFADPRARADAYARLDADRFVFRACLPQGCHAWVSDGTAAGTRSLETAADGQTTANPSHFLAWQGRLYFDINPPIAPYRGIASTDGTPEGTRVELMEGDTELLAATPSHLFLAAGYSVAARNAAGEQKKLTEWPPFEVVGVLGERLLFTYGESGGSLPPHPGFSRLASSNGEPEGTFDLSDGGGSAGVRLGDALHFGFSDGSRGDTLWRSDGSVAGTAEVMAVPDVARSGDPRPFLAGGVLAVEARDIRNGPPFLFRLDPETLEHARVGDAPLRVTAAGGGRVFATASLEGEAAPNFSFDGEALTELPFTGSTREGGAFAADGHFFFFTTEDEVPGMRLVETDGSAAGTRVLDELAQRSEGAIAISGDSVFYQGTASITSRIGVWDRLHGEKRLLVQGTRFLPELLPLPGGRALFRQRTFPELDEIFWRSDGSAEGTGAFLSFPAAEQSLVAAVAGNRFYLVLPAVYGEEGSQSLWAGDLSDAGVRQVVPPGGRLFRQLVPAGDHLFFVYQSSAGRELGFTDGSAAGTRYFDLRPGPASSTPENLYVLADQRLVFAATGDGAGDELWISDGTESGTYRLTDLNPGEAASSPSDFLQVGGRIYFQASDGVRGRELWGLDLPPAQPACPADRLCLQNDRFAVKVTAHAPDGDFVGRRALSGAESGTFSFFAENNWELLVKVLDGCGVNEAFWVFAAAPSDVAYTLEVEDRASGSRKTWESPAGAARPILDVGAFAGCALPAPAPIHSPALAPAGAAGRCPTGDSNGADLCLGAGGRYRVSLDYHAADESGPALPLPDGSADSGLFTFFSPTNWEMLVKVLDGCALNGKMWVFAAGTTDVGWSLTVEDRATGARKAYGNPAGQAAPALVDLGAFACD